MSTVQVASPDAPAGAGGPPPAPRRRSKHQQGLTRKNAAVAYALIAPNLVLFMLFLFLPLVLTAVLSFQKSTGIGPTTFVGFTNYSDMVKDGVFWRALANTALFVVITVPLGLGLGLGLALLLNAPLRGRTLLRGIFYLPYVISGVVIAVLGRFIFNENVGVLNRLLRALGFAGIPWQSNGVAAMAAVIAVLTWSRLGFVMVIYLAGLQSVPRELYDAARVDGASSSQLFRHITWPQLRPTTFFLVVMLVIESFNIFDVIYVMTGGGPGNATNMLVTYAYQTGFGARRQGYGATIGVVLYVIVAVCTVLWWRTQRSKEGDV